MSEEPMIDASAGRPGRLTRHGEDLALAQARRVCVVENDVPDSDGEGELIALVTTIMD